MLFLLQPYLAYLPFRSAPVASINDYLVPVSVSLPTGGHRQQPLQSRPPRPPCEPA